MDEKRRHRLDTTLAGLAPGITSGWLAHEETTAATQERRPATAPSIWLVLAWCQTGASRTIETGAIQYQAKHLSVILPGSPLDHRVEEGEVFRLRYAALAGPLVDGWTASLPEDAVQPGARLLKLPRAERTMLRLTDPDQIVGDPCGWAWCGILAQVLAMVDEALRRGVDENLVVRTRQLVDGNPARSWTLAAIARYLGASERSLTRQFRRQTGKSVMRWVRERRMHLAEAMLVNGMSVTAVAEALNASSPYSFSRCYKEAMGIPPSQVPRFG